MPWTKGMSDQSLSGNLCTTWGEEVKQEMRRGEEEWEREAKLTWLADSLPPCRSLVWS